MVNYLITPHCEIDGVVIAPSRHVPVSEAECPADVLVGECTTANPSANLDWVESFYPPKTVNLVPGVGCFQRIVGYIDGQYLEAWERLL